MTLQTGVTLDATRVGSLQSLAGILLPVWARLTFPSSSIFGWRCLEDPSMQRYRSEQAWTNRKLCYKDDVLGNQDSSRVCSPLVPQ